MRKHLAFMLALAAVLCSTVQAVAPRTVVLPKTSAAQVWLTKVAALPATADNAYAQWSDTTGVLKPNAAAEQVSAGIKSDLLELQRPVENTGTSSTGPGSARPSSTGSAGMYLSAHDAALVAKITPFPYTGTVNQIIQAARQAQGTMLQKWYADLNSLEQRRLQERSALPACHNEAGLPSQADIRDVELAFVKQRMEVALRNLADAQSLVDQLLKGVSPRIAYGDDALSAGSQLQSPTKRAELAPLAHGLESDALNDVALLQHYIQEFSKLAAKPVAERKAISRVYAQARGC